MTYTLRNLLRPDPSKLKISRNIPEITQIAKDTKDIYC